MAAGSPAQEVTAPLTRQRFLRAVPCYGARDAAGAATAEDFHKWMVDVTNMTNIVFRKLWNHVNTQKIPLPETLHAML